MNSIALSFDQWVNLFAAIGNWFAALGTITVVLIALWLSRRSEKVRLIASAGIMTELASDNGPKKRCFVLKATNVGQRAVTILATGWSIGKGKSKRAWVYEKPLMEPREIRDGETAQFVADLEESSTKDWIRQLAKDIVQDGSKEPLKTLRAQIHTSVGHTENVVPDKSFLTGLKKLLECDSLRS